MHLQFSQVQLLLLDCFVRKACPLIHGAMRPAMMLRHAIGGVGWLARSELRLLRFRDFARNKWRAKRLQLASERIDFNQSLAKATRS